MQQVVAKRLADLALRTVGLEGRLARVGVDLDELVAEAGLYPVALDDPLEHRGELGHGEDRHRRRSR